MTQVFTLLGKTRMKTWVLSSNNSSEKDCVDFIYLEHEQSIFEDLTYVLPGLMLLDNLAHL
jgi:hypothetical protein